MAHLLNDPVADLLEFLFDRSINDCSVLFRKYIDRQMAEGLPVLLQSVSMDHPLDFFRFRIANRRAITWMMASTFRTIVIGFPCPIIGIILRCRRYHIVIEIEIEFIAIPGRQMAPEPGVMERF